MAVKIRFPWPTNVRFSGVAWLNAHSANKMKLFLSAINPLDDVFVEDHAQPPEQFYERFHVLGLRCHAVKKVILEQDQQLTVK